MSRATDSPVQRKRISKLAALLLAIGLLITILGGSLPGARAQDGPSIDEIGLGNDATPTEEPLPAETRQRVEQLVREHSISTHHPDPAPWAYFGDLVSHLFRALVERLTPLLGDGDWLATTVRWLARLLFVLALIVVALAVRRWLRGRIAEPAPVAAATQTLPTEPDRQADRERAVLDCLRDGPVEAALEALWWWLAECLGDRDADPSWTTRELVSRHDRRDLAAPVRLFDRLVYGAAEPRIEEVRALYQQLRQRLVTEAGT
jgi:hypothetical protein